MKKTKTYHTATREDYDALMIELGRKGYRWNDGSKMQDYNGFWHHKELTIIETREDKTVIFKQLDKDKKTIEYKSKGDDMLEKE